MHAFNAEPPRPRPFVRDRPRIRHFARRILSAPARPGRPPAALPPVGTLPPLPERQWLHFRLVDPGCRGVVRGGVLHLFVDPYLPPATSTPSSAGRPEVRVAAPARTAAWRRPCVHAAFCRATVHAQGWPALRSFSDHVTGGVDQFTLFGIDKARATRPQAPNASGHRPDLWLATAVSTIPWQMNPLIVSYA